MTFIFKWKIVIGSFWREKKRTSLRKQKINKMKCRVWTRKKQGGCISNYFWNSVFYKINPKHSAPVLLGEKHSGLKGNHWIWRHWQIPISHHHKNIAPHYSWVINFYKHNAREAVVSSSTEAIWWTLGGWLGRALIQQGLGQLKYYGYVLLVTRLGNGSKLC